jgi:PHD/YefM family antitoxin component YafN of YafNO toxin-antitoxin module
MSVPSPKVRTVSLTDLDGQTAEVVRLVHEQRELVALTRDGSRLAVVLSPEVFDRMQVAAEQLRLQRAVDKAERELSNGDYVTDEDMMSELDRWAADGD